MRIDSFCGLIRVEFRLFFFTGKSPSSPTGLFLEFLSMFENSPVVALNFLPLSTNVLRFLFKKLKIFQNVVINEVFPISYHKFAYI